MDAVTTSNVLLTPREAASVLGIGRTKLYELIASGRLFSLRIDGCRRIPRASVDAFVAALMASAPAVHNLSADVTLDRQSS
jgi:excisionase family DNA binding protein